MNETRIRSDAQRRTSDVQRGWSKKRRARNAESGACINENLRGTHGQATHGVRCAACAAVYKRSI
jgi:hypothetical protein